jgi:hypothetical protein
MTVLYHFEMHKFARTKVLDPIYIFTVLIFLAFSTSARALDLTAVGTFQGSELSTGLAGGFDTATIGSTTFTNNGFNIGSSFGGGVLLSQTVIPNFYIETGFLSLPRSMSQIVNLTGNVNSSLTANLNFAYWQIPVLFRAHFLEMFTLGFGGYYAHAVGNIKYSDTASNSALNTALAQEGTLYQGYEQAGISRSDYGLLYAIGADIPVPVPFIPLSIYLDARYALGLKDIHAGQFTAVNLANSGDVNRWHDFQLLVGLQISLEKKDSSSASALVSTPPPTPADSTPSK